MEERKYSQTFGVKNDQARKNFVEESITRISKEFKSSPSILDVGAGLSPFRDYCLSLGYSYVSHDFSQYLPNQEHPGLQNESWNYPLHKYVCDILDIPSDDKYDVVLCTEVLEHVPDPVAALRHITTLIKPRGQIIITVPLLSLMHQAPFWFSAGLSPFWFRYWSNELNLDIVQMKISGDYLDLMSQEIERTFSFLPSKVNIGKLIGLLASKLRRFAHRQVLESGGFSVHFVGRKY